MLSFRKIIDFLSECDFVSGLFPILLTSIINVCFLPGLYVDNVGGTALIVTLIVYYNHDI